MSYSVCFNCRSMVSSYQKYCVECRKKYRQDETFWNCEPGAGTLFRNDVMRIRELKKDALEAMPSERTELTK